MDLSTVQLIGRVQPADAEARFTPDGRAVTQFRFVVGRGKKNADGRWDNESDWYRIVCFGKLAETMAERAVKGSRLYVSGRLVHRPWTDSAGKERMSIEVMANEVILLDAAPSRAAGPASEPAGDDFADMPF